MATWRMRNKSVVQEPNFSAIDSHSYMLCGWSTYSEIKLTEVPTTGNDPGNCDVTIRVATGHPPITKSPEPINFQHSAQCSVIGIEDVATFEVRAGRQIRVWPAAGAAQKDIEIFLLGPAWAILCHQRGTLPLHASAIVTGRGITAFAGHSGVGKSTTAGLLNSLGYELIADDILPVSFNQNSIPGAWPYLRRLKLHRIPIKHLTFTPTESVGENLDKEKYFVRPKSIGKDRWRRLDRLYLMDNDPDSLVRFEQITGADAVRALVDQTYHFKYIVDTRGFANHLAFCTQLASKIVIYRLGRWPLHDKGEKLGSLICAHLEGAGANVPSGF